MKTVIAIMGPTASGKTKLAIELAEHLDMPIDIISVDSALVYQGMDIGTAKPGADILAAYPHALVDILSPDKTYSVASFRQDALYAIEQAFENNHIPLLVGGTMLYYRALIQGLAEMPAADLSIRQALNHRLQQEGSPLLHAELATIDPVSASNIHPNDPQRIQRALEVFQLTGRPLSEFHQQPSQATRFSWLKFIIAPSDRGELHNRIRIRFEDMLKNGFVEELAQLRTKYSLDISMSSMRTVGYRQVWQYLDERFDRSTMLDKGIIATRQLAKRQLTWLRRESNANWLDTESYRLADVLDKCKKNICP